MAWQIPLLVARAIASLAGSKGPPAAVAKFGGKYGKDVVERAQRVVQQHAKRVTSLSKSARKKIAEGKEVTDTAKQGRKIRGRQGARKTERKDVEKQYEQNKPFEFKKGGPVKSGVDGIALKGKTRGSHRYG